MTWGASQSASLDIVKPNDGITNANDILIDEKMSLTQLLGIREAPRDQSMHKNYDLLTKLEVYRLELLEKDLTIQALRRELESQANNHAKQLLDVRKELHSTTEALKKERMSRDVVAQGSCVVAISISHTWRDFKCYLYLICCYSKLQGRYFDWSSLKSGERRDCGYHQRIRTGRIPTH